jgi:hypothetical protein
MQLCEAAWLGPSPENPPNSAYNYINILMQGGQQLTRILQLCKITPASLECPLIFIHLMLNISWTEMRQAICYLCQVIGEDKAGLCQLLDYVSPPVLVDEPMVTCMFLGQFSNENYLGLTGEWQFP